MAIAKIEPTGCEVRKGKIKLRISLFLEPTDPRYEEHHIQVPIIPPEGYPEYTGELDAQGNPVDEEDYLQYWRGYNQWLESLPKEWQNNPFHNHFVYVDADITETEIKQLMAERLKEFFGIWSRGQDIAKVWRPKGRLVAGDMSARNIKKCQLKVKNITKRASEFEARRS